MLCQVTPPKSGWKSWSEFPYGHFHHARCWIEAGDAGHNFLGVPEDAYAALPVAAGMGADEVYVRMAPGKLNQIVGRRFTRFIAIKLEPGVLQDGDLHRRGALHNRIHLGNAAAFVCF